MPMSHLGLCTPLVAVPINVFSTPVVQNGVTPLINMYYFRVQKIES